MTKYYRTVKQKIMLYKDKKDQTIEVDIKELDGKINFLFSSDCGKFGTDEILDEYILTPERLLQILQERGDITEDE